MLTSRKKRIIITYNSAIITKKPLCGALSYERGFLMDREKRAFFGAEANEELHFFIFDSQDGKPIHIENVGHTLPNKDYCIRRTNSNYFIFEYVISGKGYLEINGGTYELSAGDVYCIEPGYDHVYYSDPEDPFEKIWINIFSDFFVEVFKRLGISGIAVFKNTHCLPLFEEIQKLSKTTNYSADICYPVTSILFQIACIIANNQSTTPPLSETAKIIKQMLDDALFSNITIEEIAKKLHFSTVQIMREFSKYFNGETPYNYLLNLKIEMAKRFLVNTNMPASEISDMLAFNDPHYFSRIFKKKTGLSPVHYRKQAK